MQHTTTQPRIAAIGYPTVAKRTTFVIALAVFGVINILTGLISLFSANVLVSSVVMPQLVNAILVDVAFDLVLGALIIASSNALAHGRMQATWLYAGCLVLDILFNLFMGYPLNYVFIGFALLIIWQIIQYKEELNLS